MRSTPRLKRRDMSYGKTNKKIGMSMKEVKVSRHPSANIKVNSLRNLAILTVSSINDETKLSLSSFFSCFFSSAVDLDQNSLPEVD